MVSAAATGIAPPARKGPLRSPEEATPAIEHVEHRRRQLIALLLTVFVLVAAGVVLFSLATGDGEGDPFGVLDLNVLRVSFVALAVVFALYVWQKERDLRRAEAALVAAQVRATSLRQRLRELSALTQAGKALSAVLSLEDLLQLIIESARDLLGATEGSVMLFDDDGRRVRVAASVGVEDAEGDAVQAGDGLAGWVAEHPEPVILHTDSGPERPQRFGPRSRKVRTIMSAPLYRAEEPVGVLRVSVTGGDRGYGEEDLDALVAFAEHAAIAIANARAYEAEREAKERLARMDGQRQEFIATLTHDLKAPLTSILGYTRLLQKGRGQFTDEQAQGFIETIDRQGRRILEMVERLVVATRLEEDGPVLTRERLDVRAIIEDQIEGLRGTLGGRQVIVRIAEGLPRIYGDPSAIEHILLNLLDNAVKHSPPESPIEIEVLAAEGEVLVSVADEGEGIPDELLPHVFERYRQASEAGTSPSVGLGLFIVHSLTTAHGGRVWAENIPGRGARITFTLPVRRDVVEL